jgi:hypothetical protein
MVDRAQLWRMLGGMAHYVFIRERIPVPMRHIVTQLGADDLPIVVYDSPDAPPLSWGLRVIDRWADRDAFTIRYDGNL